jgi:hypothetical protein
LFTWRKLATQGALTATAAEEEVVPASEYRALQNHVKELQRLLGKKTMEGEILKEARESATGRLQFGIDGRLHRNTHFEHHDIKLCRILTDRGTEYCGSPDRHEYELYLAVEDIDHTRTKTKSPQTNGMVEPFHKNGAG